MSMYKANVTTNGATASVSIAPPRSITAFLGTIDPDGWVICNGVQRTNGSDGRYNNLVAASIGTGTANGNYTPPDYRGAFLRGAGTNPNKSGYAGATVGSSQDHATQTHNHDITDPGHKHTVNGTGSSNALSGTKSSWNNDPTAFLVDYMNKGFTGITIKDSETIIVNSIQRLTDPNETRPYNFGVNWIIKL